VYPNEIVALATTPERFEKVAVTLVPAAITVPLARAGESVIVAEPEPNVAVTAVLTVMACVALNRTTVCVLNG
jgi:hypothetical protein